MKLLELSPSGLYCPPAEVFIDPWRAVDKAVITHAHSDHARRGMKHYLAHQHSSEVLKLRLGQGISIQTLPYAQPIEINGVRISLHPAGHIPGSAQVRLEYHGKVAVVSGDYKVEADGLSESFEPVPCHEFVSECTFGLPIYKWEKQAVIFEGINAWWKQNSTNGLNSVLFAYSLGKAQRILNNLDSSIGPVYVHSSIWQTNKALMRSGISVLDAPDLETAMQVSKLGAAMIISPPTALTRPLVKKISPFRTGVCSGWMQASSARKRMQADKGFVLSDHADWEGLITAIKGTEAEKVYLTHGSTAVFARYLKECEGIHAVELKTLFQGENGDLGDS